jgi:hypothetical protein
MKVNFNLVQATNVQRRSRDILYFFFNIGARCGWVVKATLQPLYSRERDTVHIVYEAGWAPGQVWTCGKNLPHTGIRSSDLPAHS